MDLVEISTKNWGFIQQSMATMATPGAPPPLSRSNLVKYVLIKGGDIHKPRIHWTAERGETFLLHKP